MKIFKKIIQSLLLLSIWLLIFDLGSQLFLAVIDNPKLNQYFSYGLSTEAQIRNMLEQGVSENSVLHAGWINKNDFIDKGSNADITFYGMSFTNHIADQLQEVKSNSVIRKIAGPAAPINYSLSAYLMDKEVCHSKVVVLGVLDSSLKYVNALTNDSIGVESPVGSFYPRFITTPEGYTQITPQINSFEDLQRAIENESLWQSNLEFLAQYDQNYSSFLYKGNLLDYSIMGRFFKRWYKSKHNSLITGKVFENNQFSEETIKHTEELITIFIKEAEKKGQFPIVLLIETPMYGNSLEQQLSPFLKSKEVTYLNTSSIVSTTDPSNFLSDGHITLDNNRKIAKQLSQIIESKL